MKKFLLIWFYLMLLHVYLHAQRKWIGGYGEQWENPLNWQPTGSPVLTDDVILDNSVDKTNYTVTLPAAAVTIASLIIDPSVGQLIKLVLPNINLSSPAFILTGTGDALILNNGATFRNASGLTSGQSLKVAGSIRINNGGSYIHNTRSAHANDIVARLSQAVGTEEGIFEFDIPSASSTISLSNRNFGKLKLSASGYNGNVTYSGGGSNPVTVRSDLEIGERVNFSIGFSNIFSIKRDFIQQGGSFNISNDNNPTILAIGRHILQTGGIITETGSAFPLLVLNGEVKQDLFFSGGILNDITVRLDNVTGAELKNSLALGYRFELKNGKLKTSSTALLTLQSNASLQADSLSKNFIDGPLKKEGLNATSHFLFPVGKSGNQRWVGLRNVTGSFTVTYQQQNPYDFSTVMGVGLHHVSSIETWTIDTDAYPLTTAQVELSFDNMYSGGVSDLNTLRVAGWITGERWADRGNTAVSGTAGAAGSVVSEIVKNFNADQRLFTLASSVSNQNTLPETAIRFTGEKEGNAIHFKWQPLSTLNMVSFTVQSAAADNVFIDIRTIFIKPEEKSFSFLYSSRGPEMYFRIRANLTDGYAFYSKVIYVDTYLHKTRITGSSWVENNLTIKYTALKDEPVLIEIYDLAGRVLKKVRKLAIKGENNIIVPVDDLSSGAYVAIIISKENKGIERFIKK